MTARRGKPIPGTRAKPEATTAPTTPTEKQVEAKNRANQNLLTAALPKFWRPRVRKLQRSGVSGPQALEADWAVLTAARDHYLAEYDRDCGSAHVQRQRAAMIREAASVLAPDDPVRVQAEALALDYDRATVDHSKAMQIVALLTDAARKAQDSLAVHRPGGHARVHVEVVSGGVRVGGAGPASTYMAEVTEEDQALLVEIEGATGEQGVDDPPPPETEPGEVADPGALAG